MPRREVPSDHTVVWMHGNSVWIGRLTRLELITLAFLVIRSLAESDREDIVYAALTGQVNRGNEPMTPFSSVMGEAQDWAAWATTEELKAYAVACYEAMAANEQAAFLAYIQRRFG